MVNAADVAELGVSQPIPIFTFVPGTPFSGETVIDARGYVVGSTVTCPLTVRVPHLNETFHLPGLASPLMIAYAFSVLDQAADSGRPAPSSCPLMDVGSSTSEIRGAAVNAGSLQVPKISTVSPGRPPPGWKEIDPVGAFSALAGGPPKTETATPAAAHAKINLVFMAFS